MKRIPTGDQCPNCKQDINTTGDSLCFCSAYSGLWRKLSSVAKRECREEIASFPSRYGIPADID